jgi:hypothetical protein
MNPKDFAKAIVKAAELYEKQLTWDGNMAMRAIQASCDACLIVNIDSDYSELIAGMLENAHDDAINWAQNILEPEVNPETDELWINKDLSEILED